MLAHMIGDGSCPSRQPVRYASIEEPNLVAVTNAAAYSLPSAFELHAISEQVSTAINRFRDAAHRHDLEVTAEKAVC